MLEMQLAGTTSIGGSRAVLLQRQARQVQRLEEQNASWRGEVPLWLVAPRAPVAGRSVQARALRAGLLLGRPARQCFLWVRQMSFRSSTAGSVPAGPVQRALDDFGRGVAPRLPPEWF